MKESYDISVFKIFKRILKSGPSVDLRRKNGVNWGKLAVPEAPYIHYLHIYKRKKRS